MQEKREDKNAYKPPKNTVKDKKGHSRYCSCNEAHLLPHQSAL